MDEEIYGVAFDFFIPPVNPFFEIGACQNRSGTQEQGMQQGKFARAEQFDNIAASRLLGRRIEADFAVAQQGRCLSPWRRMTARSLASNSLTSNGLTR